MMNLDDNVPYSDPLIEEVRRIRESLSHRFDDDLGKLFNHLRQIEAEHAERVLQPVALSRSAVALPTITQLEHS
jgi:hypothetical protein